MGTHSQASNRSQAQCINDNHNTCFWHKGAVLYHAYSTVLRLNCCGSIKNHAFNEVDTTQFILGAYTNRNYFQFYLIIFKIYYKLKSMYSLMV